MKKSILVLLGLGISLMAAEDWQYECDVQDIQQFGSNKYIPAAISEDSLVVADTRSIQIDNKKKLIKVWVNDIATPTGKQNITNVLGQYYDISNYGYDEKMLWIDYKNMRFKTIQYSGFDCDGRTIFSVNDDKWVNFYPQSTIANIVRTIKQKFNLK